MNERPLVFICYRWDDAGSDAQLLKHELKSELDAEFFIDEASVKPGDSIGDKVMTALRKAKYVLVLIGPTWATIGKENDGVARLFRKEDPVRTEIELAQRLRRQVIPVLIKGAKMPDASELPEAIQFVRELRALHINSDSRDPGVHALSRFLAERGVPRTEKEEHAVNEAGVSEKKDGLPFLRWLRGHRWRYAGLATLLLGIASQLDALWRLVPFEPIANHPDVDQEAAHFVICFALWSFLFFANGRVARATRPSEAQREKLAVRHFTRMWHWVFAFLALFYLLRAMGHLPAFDGNTTAEVVFAILTATANNVVWFFLACCYFILAEESVTRTHEELDNPRVTIAYEYILPPFLLLVVATVVMGFMRESSFAWYVADRVIALLSGAVNGVVLALFVGRLDSKFVSPPTVLLILLYCYACIQPLVAVFGVPAGTASIELGHWVDAVRDFEAILIPTALALKLLLFVFVLWALETRRLHFYMVRAYETIKSNPEAFKRYLGGVDVGVTSIVGESDKYYRCFLSAPMSSLSDGAFEGAMNEVCGIWDACTTRLGRTFFAGLDKRSKHDFDDATETLEVDLEAVGSSERFVLVYLEAATSSVLVEAGIALALGLPSVYFVRKKSDLPFMLRRADSAPSTNVRIVEVEDYAAIIREIEGGALERLGSNDRSQGDKPSRDG